MDFVRTLLILFGILHTCLSVQLLVTVPKEAYYDTELKASLSAFGVAPGHKELVTLKYKGLKDTSRVLNSTIIEFTADGLQEWKVMFTWDRIQQLEESGVMLEVSSGDLYSYKKAVTFNQKFGYIFIQTDKPVYTPRQKVMFRVIALDEYQKLSKYSVRIDILNHNRVVVDRMISSAAEAFTAKVFELPKETQPGTWFICANFEGVNNIHGAFHEVSFEVKEYVLPRMSTILSINPDVITNGTQWITATVVSKYVYGRPIDGSVDVKFGVWANDGITNMLPFSFKGQLENGRLSQDINIRQLFPNPRNFPAGRWLYVKATVTEVATLEEDVVVSTFLLDQFYKVDFTSSKRYFKPGFPYTFEARVSAQNNRPPSAGVPLHVKAFFYDERNSYIGGGPGTAYSLDSLGIMKHDFDIPPAAQSIKFEAVVLDVKVPEFVKFTHNANKFVSSHNEYIHISIASHVQKNKNGAVVLHYTRPSGSAGKITILVLSRGHVIYTATSTRNSEGLSQVQLPAHLYAEVTPSMRVVAYYVVQGDSLTASELVADSLFVDTPDTCLEEIFIRNGRSTDSGTEKYSPGDKYVLKIEGGASMNVGLVAVDKAVLLLSDKQTLTRDLLFSELASHDKGSGVADEGTVDKIFENSGVHYIFIDVEKEKEEPSLLHGRYVETRKQTDRVNHIETATSSSVLPIFETPPQTVRRYFPESWLFEEWRLPPSGNLNLNLTLPDSITTWSFLAVGLSSTRGFCVSNPLEQSVEQLFFADVRLPYKASRLEEIKIRIAVYNYHNYRLKVDVRVTGPEGLCFSDNITSINSQNGTRFTLFIEPGQAQGTTVKVIPLRTGDLPIRVDLASQSVTDVVEKLLYVVAEGQRIVKSITFVLDPEAKHSTFTPKRNRKLTYESAVVSNVIDPNNKEQQTRIDLALPKDVIRGSEHCRISAFGDLMGDIINNAVVESKSLLVSAPVQCAEQVMGDLGPTVHALSYVNNIDLKVKKLKDKGKKFIKLGITRLLNYRSDNYSFKLKPDSKPATWLTAFVLKTLCHATELTFVDRDNLVKHGFLWLYRQISPDGTVREEDWRLMKDSAEYKILLGAEVLISIMECKNLSEKSPSTNILASNLGNSVGQIRDPMILAKVTYALMLFDRASEPYRNAVRRLLMSRRKSKYGHFYWSQVEESFDLKGTSFWHTDTKAHASAIEATAYALMVFISQGHINVDAIADWLVWQRNPSGAFISAMDSTVAIQALSSYSLRKYKLEVNLQCNVSSDRQKDLSYSFNFTQENAFNRKSLNNVPVGQVLDVLTRGQGLGQMQVNVEFNIPVDKNKHCDFKISITISKTEIFGLSQLNMTGSSPYCKSCSLGCPRAAQPTTPSPAVAAPRSTSRIVAEMRVKVPKPKGRRGRKPASSQTRLQNQRQSPSGIRNHPRAQQSRRQARSTIEDLGRSLKSICIHVCLQHRGQGPSAPTEVKIEMLTGYKPVAEDINWIKKLPYVAYAEFDEDQETLIIHYSEIACTEETCFSFRAVDVQEADRLMPASVEVKSLGRNAPQCVTEYQPPPEYMSLNVYCADLAHGNKGECKCFSGLCSACKPIVPDEIELYELQKFACKSPIGYQLQIASINSTDRWAEIDARVISINKTGADNITHGSVIKLRTPNTCRCPINVFGMGKFYLLSSDIERLSDAHGNIVNFYHLDERSLFLRVAEPGTKGSSELSMPHAFVQEALSSTNICHN